MMFILIAIVTMILPDVYIWYNFLIGRSLLTTGLFFVPTLAIVTLTILALNGISSGDMMRWSFTLLLSLSIPKLLFTLVSIIGKIVSLGLPSTSPYFNLLGTILGGIFLVIALIGLTYGWKHIQVNKIEVAHTEIPKSFDGYRIVQLSDMHIGTYQYAPEVVEELVQRVNKLQPDAILFTGDLVNMSPDEISPFVSTLKKLQAKDGVYSIMGNHDYCMYSRLPAAERAKNVQRIRELETELGWELLRNEHVMLHRGADSIALVGVENAGKPPYPNYANLAKAMMGLEKGVYKILMSHDPTHWRREVLDTDINLTLSGHTHAMQFRIGNFSPSQFTYPEWGGLYEASGKLLNVSTGCGSNIPFRFGAWPEIMVIELKSDAQHRKQK
jgi:hypothetical protein